MARRMTLSLPSGEPLFDQAEAALVQRALASLRHSCPRDAGILWAQLKRLGLLGEALEAAPSLYLSSTLGLSTRDENTLINQLSHIDPLLGELHLPEKAVIAHAFLAAKISLLRAFLVALAPGAPGSDAQLTRELKAELAQSIYTAIASDILAGLLYEAGLDATHKVRAAKQLMLIWDRATHVEIDDFCPLLEAAWQARSQLAPGYGALLGTAEYLRLVQQNCPDQFLDFFTRDAVSVGENQSFEEFLFGLPHEDLVTLRTRMHVEQRCVIDTIYASQVLGRQVDETARLDDPETLYRSYRRRRGAADLRRLNRAEGPSRVAEAYLMTYVLDLADRPHAKTSSTG